MPITKQFIQELADRVKATVAFSREDDRFVCTVNNGTMVGNLKEVKQYLLFVHI